MIAAVCQPLAARRVELRSERDDLISVDPVLGAGEGQTNGKVIKKEFLGYVQRLTPSSNERCGSTLENAEIALLFSSPRYSVGSAYKTRKRADPTVR